MAYHISSEEKLVLRFIEKTNVAETAKKQWTKAIQETGLSEELVEAIREKLAKRTASQDQDEFATGREMFEFNSLARKWRLALNKKKFHERR